MIQDHTNHTFSVRISSWQLVICPLYSCWVNIVERKSNFVYTLKVSTKCVQIKQKRYLSISWFSDHMLWCVQSIIGPRYTWGLIYSVSSSLMFVNFVDDATLADEDTSSIPTDNASRAIKGNLAMQVTRSGGQLWKCRHLVVKFVIWVSLKRK